MVSRPEAIGIARWSRSCWTISATPARTPRPGGEQQACRKTTGSPPRAIRHRRYRARSRLPALPLQPLEEGGYLGCRVIWPLMVWEMAGIGEGLKIETGEELAQPVGPGDIQRRVVLGPADAGRQIDRWRQFALGFAGAPLRDRAISGESALQVPRLLHARDEGVERRLVERLRTVCPQVEKVGHEQSYSIRRGTQQRDR